jgi:hypothetical protein
VTRPPDLEAALAVFREVFKDAEVLCSFCREHEAEPGDTWCRDCHDLFLEHVGPLLDGGVLTHFGPTSRSRRELDTSDVVGNIICTDDGICSWCRERPTEVGSSLCIECDGGTDTASIGVPLSDARVRALGFVPTARGWVPRTAELRERLDAADRARTAEREAADERAAALRRVIRRVRRMA